MRPPHSSIPSEISLMPGFAGRAAGEIGVDLMDRRGQRHNFGILRLLKFSEELRNLHNVSGPAVVGRLILMTRYS